MLRQQLVKIRLVPLGHPGRLADISLSDLKQLNEIVPRELNSGRIEAGQLRRLALGFLHLLDRDHRAGIQRRHLPDDHPQLPHVAGPPGAGQSFHGFGRERALGL